MMLFLLIDLCFAVVVFPFFGASKDSIRDSQKLQFCNFVRLQKKAQDVITRKEGQSKNYLSYPKPF